MNGLPLNPDLKLKKRARVLVVEDSPTVRDFLLAILRSDPALEIAGTAATGEDAVRLVEETCPDVITMDVHMPKMNGFDATRLIMESRPTPIVMVSGTTDFADSARAFEAMESGALAVLQRPHGPGHAEHQCSAAELLRTVKLMAEVKVVKRWRHARQTAVAVQLLHGPEISPQTKYENFNQRIVSPKMQLQMVGIGASTGGPPAIQKILSLLPRDFAAPVLIVQHMAEGFTQGLADWLAQSSSLPVLVPSAGQKVINGHVYIAPEAVHMGVDPGGRIELRMTAPEHGLRPAVSYLFRSIAEVYGAAAAGVLLSGMGTDGAQELKMMRQRGAVTLVQNCETSVVYGMPGEAVKLDGASYVLSPEKIAGVLRLLVEQAGEEVEACDGEMSVTPSDDLAQWKRK